MDCSFAQFYFGCDCRTLGVCVNQGKCCLIVIRNLSELHGSIQTWRFFAWESILGIVASQGLLIENCCISTEETPFCGLNNLSLIVLNWETDVEHLEKYLVDFVVNSNAILIHLEFRNQSVQ